MYFRTKKYARSYIWSNEIVFGYNRRKFNVFYMQHHLFFRAPARTSFLSRAKDTEQWGPNQAFYPAHRFCRGASRSEALSAGLQD
ncbi:MULTISPECIES: hypothetical protein [unclassified Mesorhizobium]|uniref:hypothetical protein n=1 Tax=unclassified Mesorhizobium TaxID=325217 RepID=UPI00112B261C|nr:MULTISPECIES: hypothetical protein [unclassified Mesorhizobium]MBZ9806979.1 hypothetical protein [Mesorhizobium sp. ESP-6-2]TPM30359.1 hypothetical protein FJ955_11265 [Mesorhizobium sp. B2-2-2]